jgi:hypothetical protein
MYAGGRQPAHWRGKMTSAQTSRYIANLRFIEWRGRVYLRWPFDEEAGEPAFRNAIHRIETEVGPASKTLGEFLVGARRIFSSQGFEEFRP